MVCCGVRQATPHPSLLFCRVELVEERLQSGSQRLDGTRPTSTPLGRFRRVREALAAPSCFHRLLKLSEHPSIGGLDYYAPFFAPKFPLDDCTRGARAAGLAIPSALITRASTCPSKAFRLCIAGGNRKVGRPTFTR